MVTRRSARIFVIDPGERVLLFLCDDPRIMREPFWITPGGGVADGEPLAVAASRELKEETGYDVPAGSMGPLIAITEGPVPAGLGFDHAVDAFFLAHVAGRTLDLSAQEDHERSVLTTHRWWSLDELRTTGDTVVPFGLADLMPRLISGDPPAEPVRLRWHH